MTQARFEDDAVFSIRPDLILEEVEGELLVLDLRGNAYFGLNEVAKIIWEAIDAGRSFVEIVGAICDHFEVEHQQAARDLAEFLSDGLDAGLLTQA